MYPKTLGASSSIRLFIINIHPTALTFGYRHSSPTLCPQPLTLGQLLSTLDAMEPVPAESPIDDLLERLGTHLVWRIGKTESGEALVVRLGLAHATANFASLPRLHNASDEDIEALVKAGQVRVEWVE